MDIDVTKHGLVNRGPAALTSRTADIIVDTLIRHGVEVIFGIPGGPIAPIYDALVDRKEVRLITTRHESGAMFAAAGYARATGKVGVVLVTSGPGVLNAMTGLASANCDGIPVLLLAGEVPRPVFGKGALQDGSSYQLNIVGMAQHICKLAIEVTHPSAAPTLLRKAIATALSGRKGPVLVTLPIDVSSTHISAPEVSMSMEARYAIEPLALERAAAAFDHGERVVLFAGSGVRDGFGPERLREFAERVQCPVMTTPKAKGVFPEDHPLSLGVYGLGGHPSATDLLDGGIDVLLAVGTSLGDLATNGWSAKLKPQREFIQVDIDGSHIGRSFPVTLAIEAPAELFFKKMIELVPVATAATFGVRHHAFPDEVEGVGAPLSPQRAIAEIQQVLPENTIFASDIGEHSLFATHFLRANRPDAWVLMGGLGSMGSGICSTLGIQIAHPDRTVAVICGDGGFAMCAGEIATAVAERLPILFFVFNDRRLGMVELGLSALYGRTTEFPNAPLAVPELAASLGAQTVVAEHPGDILAANLLARRSLGPVVIDVLIDRRIKMPKNGRFEALGSVTSRKVMN